MINEMKKTNNIKIWIIIVLILSIIALSWAFYSQLKQSKKIEEEIKLNIVVGIKELESNLHPVIGSLDTEVSSRAWVEINGSTSNVLQNISLLLEYDNLSEYEHRILNSMDITFRNFKYFVMRSHNLLFGIKEPFELSPCGKVTISTSEDVHTKFSEYYKLFNIFEPLERDMDKIYDETISRWDTDLAYSLNSCDN